MADLIDRKAAIDALHKWEGAYNWDENCLEDREKVYAPSEVIEDLPAAEPEIVRCKDCKHCEDYGNGYTSRCTLGNLMDDVLGFCSDAERRTDE